MRIIHRAIRVGDRVLIGAVCTVCESAVIYPVEALRDHLLRHSAPLPPLELDRLRPKRYRGGKPLGSKNRTQMSPNGVVYRGGIRRPR